MTTSASLAATPDVPRGPLPPNERSAGIDALRGVAVLGILLVNVRSFALPDDAYIYPFVRDPATASDLWAYALTTVFAQGKFITIFAALYGAGVVLSTRRRDAAGAASFGSFLRRSLVLAGVGVAHMLLLWPGDVLFVYAAVGLLAYTMRRWPTGRLWFAAAGGMALTVGILLALAGVFWLFGHFGTAESPDLTPDERVGRLLLDPAAWEAEIQAVGGSGFLAVARGRASETIGFQLFLLVLFGPALLGRMLAGIALLRGGFLTGGWAGRRYALAAAAAGGVGFGGAALVTYLGWQNGFAPIYWLGLAPALLEALAPLAAFGLAAGVIGLARRGGLLVTIFARVGRMAFTNYLAQSLLGTAIFYGWGLGYFGRIGYAGQLPVVAGVWMLEIIWSNLWLARYRFGPLEWLWRGATYGRLPPLRKRPTGLSSPHARDVL